MSNSSPNEQSHKLRLVTCKKLFNNFNEVIESLRKKDQIATISRHGRWIALVSPAQLSESLASTDPTTHQPPRGQRVVSFDEPTNRFTALMHDLIETNEIAVISQKDEPVAAICPLAPGIESRLIVMALESGIFDLEPSSASSVPLEEFLAEKHPLIPRAD